MASKSYGWDVRNIAKISPKWPKTAIFRLFSLFSKTVRTIRTKFSTVILHHIRVLYVQWHQNRIAGMRGKQPKLAQKWPKNSHFRLFSLFSKTVRTIRTKFSTVILHHIRVLYVQWHQNRMAGMRGKQPKLAQKWPKNSHFRLFSIFSKTVHTIRTKFSTVILHHIMVFYVQFHYIRMAGM